MISITIDGKTTEVPEGTTVLRAAEQAGITIPTLCDHPALPPYGGCRLCVVEVQGFRTPIASCTLPASQGMVVNTDTEKLRSIRKFVLTMLFSERNHFCPFCQKTGGDCELQNAAYGEDMTHWPISPNWTPFPVDASHPFFIFDHNRCILCRRCVRACASMTGNFTLDLENRGTNTMIVADYGLPMAESTCIRCGSCVQVCPTGALIDRYSAYQGLEKDADELETLCLGCSVGCGLHLLVRDNRIIRVLGEWDAPVNKGVLCELGRYETLNEKRSRVEVPMVRKNGGLAPVSWDEALQTVANKLQTISGDPEKRVAALASTRLTAEQLYAFQQLFNHGLNSSMVTSLEGSFTKAVLADSNLYGTFDDLKASDCVLVIGADLVNSHQVAGFFVKRNRPAGVRIILVDPAENATSEVANLVLNNQPGSDEALIRGLLYGVINLGFSKDGGSPIGVEAIAQAAQISGIGTDTLLTVCRELGQAEKPVIIIGKGVTRSSGSTLVALEDLAHVTGAVLVNVNGKANTLAAQSYQLDKVFDPGNHEVVYVALGDDYLTPRLTENLNKSSYLVLQTSYENALMDFADVVLPVEMWAEQAGHFLNLEGRLQESKRVLAPAAAVRSNMAVFQNLADLLGVELDENWKELLQERVHA